MTPFLITAWNSMACITHLHFLKLVNCHPTVCASTAIVSLLIKRETTWALKGATRTSQLAKCRHSAVQMDDLPASLVQPMIMIGV